MSNTPTILIVPGLRDHVPAHWQTLLEEKWRKAGRPIAAVPPLEHDKLSCAARVAALDEALSRIDGPVILVAHSAGCMIVAHWAEQHRRAIHGAVLAAPADLASPMPEGYPSPDAIAASGWLPIPRRPLPFPSIVAASTNDPLGRFERISALAEAWGSRLVNIGAAGHLNPAAGYGEWPQAEELIEALR